MKAAKQQGAEIIIERLSVGEAQVWIKGQTPLIYNAMSEKVKQGMLIGGQRKTAAEKASSLRQYPIEEFRDSVYKRSGDGPTRLVFPAVAFKRGAVDVIRHIPNSGTSMVAMKQLMWVVNDTVDIYGVPLLYMAVVKQAGLTGAPQMRTRAILPDWCCCVTVRYSIPMLTETTVARLLEAAGLLIGIGDFRQQKGAGNYGQFALAEKADCAAIIKAGGMAAQDAALESPECYDVETRELLAWYQDERARRGR